MATWAATRSTPRACKPPRAITRLRMTRGPGVLRRAAVTRTMCRRRDASKDEPSRVQRSSSADSGKRLMTAALSVAAFASPWITPFVVTTVNPSASHTRGAARAAEATAEATPTGNRSSPSHVAGVDFPKLRARELTPRHLDFLRWIEGVRDECVKRGVSQATISACFDRLEPRPEPPPPPPAPAAAPGEAPKPPSQETRKVEKYLERIVTRDRVEMGAVLIRKHADLLAEVEREYGVPSEIIVAIWGIESSFGGFAGDSDCIEALANLGWEQQQDNYFRNELIEAVRIIDLGHVSTGKLTGSWDGGLGQCQFMPSNFHAYAVDKDGDGRADIWDSLPDVFASMGNFIRTYCEWDPRVRSAGFKVTVDSVADLPEDAIGGYWGERKPARPAKFFLWNGVHPVHKESALPPSAETALLMPDGADGLAFLATSNFRSIMRYNPSTQYAMAVSTLAQEIADEAAEARRAEKAAAS